MSSNSRKLQNVRRSRPRPSPRPSPVPSSSSSSRSPPRPTSRSRPKPSPGSSSRSRPKPRQITSYSPVSSLSSGSYQHTKQSAPPEFYLTITQKKIYYFLFFISVILVALLFISLSINQDNQAVKILIFVAVGIFVVSSFIMTRALVLAYNIDNIFLLLFMVALVITSLIYCIMFGTNPYNKLYHYIAVSFVIACFIMISILYHRITITKLN